MVSGVFFVAPRLCARQLARARVSEIRRKGQKRSAKPIALHSLSLRGDPMKKRNRIFVMCFGLAGNHGNGVSADGNSFSTSWYLRGPDEFVKCVGEHYKPSEVDGCIIIDNRAVLEERPGLAVT